MLNWRTSDLSGRRDIKIQRWFQDLQARIAMKAFYIAEYTIHGHSRNSYRQISATFFKSRNSTDIHRPRWNTYKCMNACSLMQSAWKLMRDVTFPSFTTRGFVILLSVLRLSFSFGWWTVMKILATLICSSNFFTWNWTYLFNTLAAAPKPTNQLVSFRWNWYNY